MEALQIGGTRVGGGNGATAGIGSSSFFFADPSENLCLLHNKDRTRAGAGVGAGSSTKEPSIGEVRFGWCGESVAAVNLLCGWRGGVWATQRKTRVGVWRGSVMIFRQSAHPEREWDERGVMLFWGDLGPGPSLGVGLALRTYQFLYRVNVGFDCAVCSDL
jgi:hypothetical protein